MRQNFGQWKTRQKYFSFNRRREKQRILKDVAGKDVLESGESGSWKMGSASKYVHLHMY